MTDLNYQNHTFPAADGIYRHSVLTGPAHHPERTGPRWWARLRHTGPTARR
jgi:hypothetical protein